jgi:hypothetical protein
MHSCACPACAAARLRDGLMWVQACLQGGGCGLVRVSVVPFGGYASACFGCWLAVIDVTCMKGMCVRVCASCLPKRWVGGGCLKL